MGASCNSGGWNKGGVLRVRTARIRSSKQANDNKHIPRRLVRIGCSGFGGGDAFQDQDTVICNRDTMQQLSWKWVVWWSETNDNECWRELCMESSAVWGVRNHLLRFWKKLNETTCSTLLTTTLDTENYVYIIQKKRKLMLSKQSMHVFPQTTNSITSCKHQVN